MNGNSKKPSKMFINTNALPANETLFNYPSGIPKEQENPTSIPLSKIILPATQPRKYFDEKKLDELTESIKHQGILQPILVRPKNDKYELVAGERRYRAAKKLNLESIPANVREMTDEQVPLFALAENLYRHDLNPIEETDGVLATLALRLGIPQEQVTSLLYKMKHESQGEIGNNVITSQQGMIVQEVFDSLQMEITSFISNRLPLLKLPTLILEAVREGKIEYTKALKISKLKVRTHQDILLEQTINQKLSLTQINKRIKEILEPKPTKHDYDPEDIFRRVKKLKSLCEKNEDKFKEPQTLAKLDKFLSGIEDLLNS